MREVESLHDEKEELVILVVKLRLEEICTKVKKKRMSAVSN